MDIEHPQPSYKMPGYFPILPSGNSMQIQSRKGSRIWLCFLLGLLSALFAHGAPKPNIIFILADDLGYGDVGVFFQNLRTTNNVRSEPSHFTPKLDALAAEGVQLRRYYCAAPVCAPSWASLLLGVHQGH